MLTFGTPEAGALLARDRDRELNQPQACPLCESTPTLYAEPSHGYIVCACGLSLTMDSKWHDIAYVRSTLVSRWNALATKEESQ